ncbi:Pentatricopeptide repeat-containing protein, partial [Cucurbita argyrosperma subsp. argyrosperma]
MMLQVGSCRELGQDSFTASLIQTNFTAKGHHYLFLNTPLASRRLSLGNLNSQKQIIRDLKVSPRFKLQCFSKTVFTPSKRLSTNGKKKSYGGVLPSILRSLKSSSDIGSILNSLCQNLSPKEQTVILKEQRQWERVLQVFQWFKSQKDYVPNVIHYNIVLRALGRAQKWDELRLCWNEMAENGIIPSNNTYGMLVDVYGKAGLVKEALLWIKHMKVRGIFPDEVTMNTVVRVLKDAGEFDSADKFYKDWTGMKIPNRQASPEVDNCARKPRLTSTFNTLIDLYGKAGRLKDAANVFAEMLKSERALKYFHLMKGAGIAENQIVLTSLIKAFSKVGSVEGAKAMYNRMKNMENGVDTIASNTMINLYTDLGMVSEAKRVFEDLRERGCADGVSFATLIYLLIKHGRKHGI